MKSKDPKSTAHSAAPAKTDTPKEKQDTSRSKSTEASIERIRQYLDDRAKTDTQFATAYAKPGKSIEGCMGHICDKVRRSGRVMWTDEEIFGLAVDYYDEDNIKESRMPSSTRIVCTNPEPRFSKSAPKPRASKKKTPGTPSSQLSLF